MGEDMARALFNAAFSRQRDPRSREYKNGVLAALRFRVNDEPIKCPYLPGTATADAYYAGTDEGHRIWWGSGNKGK